MEGLRNWAMARSGCGRDGRAPQVTPLTSGEKAQIPTRFSRLAIRNAMRHQSNRSSAGSSRNERPGTMQLGQSRSGRPFRYHPRPTGRISVTRSRTSAWCGPWFPLGPQAGQTHSQSIQTGSHFASLRALCQPSKDPKNGAKRIRLEERKATTAGGRVKAGSNSPASARVFRLTLRRNSLTILLGRNGERARTMRSTVCPRTQATTPMIAKSPPT